ncbi:MAG TPA: trifunctional transcriptional regulator/proline dehydrogenase/L-glutamate gamma-semialdehyde dehydrogenase [Stellaceae bacterium]|nr:trifunctional transcriptional regulator/proline dehydrogenase/L-glutamate gamma-semialdehyde dehydrogenase [Stellaceae bacterium]
MTSCPRPIRRSQSLTENRPRTGTMDAVFQALCDDVQPLSPQRRRIAESYRTPEPECVPPLIEAASLPSAVTAAARKTARGLVAALRARNKGGGVEALVQEYALSSEEGVALMCLAEALLRIPDSATRDRLIRDKIGGGDWRSHLGHSPSLFVNAATWGLVVTGDLTATAHEGTLSNALVRIIARGGEPVIRKGVDLAMRMMGEQFVTGQTIAEALARARKLEARGFRYSYDMLGEAATTAADAQRYFSAYEQAIHAIGAAAAGRGIYEGPGISIKLSALHPRYGRAQRARVMTELLPRVQALALLARRYDIGLNIDAEEADRLDLSLDILEALCMAPELDGWNGIGFVVQAYQKRAPFVLDFVIELARRTNHRLMLRLVKGAYWDAEIKRAQIDGLEGFPVFTRKVYTDVSYIACARKLLAAPDAVFPQFATHNAMTLATIHAMAGGNFYIGQYEFQCLHGMGEPLYDEVVGKTKLNRPCRIYAPVGTHETLLAYLVRRLLENGANSSFVNRISNPEVAIDELVADPVAEAAKIKPPGAPHERISLPRHLFGTVRMNSAGLDLSSEINLAYLAEALAASADKTYHAVPLDDGSTKGSLRTILNPANHGDKVGVIEEADADLAAHAMAAAEQAAPAWAAVKPVERAACLERAAELMETLMVDLIGIIVREAGKSLANAVGEVREAVDFLRYYAAEIRSHFDNATHIPLGPVVCISPWNFPLAIFTGQVAAALAAGNTVVAKPADETPLIASIAVEILREAGVPDAAVQCLPGPGPVVGQALVADARMRGVMFTGSTEVAKLIQKQLASRLNPNGAPVPLIAETGGQNALIVDSSALSEQVVADVLQSAFDSAGQRCSALRVLCVQEDVASHILAMLKGALNELTVGSPDRLATDIGPVITEEARANIAGHVEAMRQAGHVVSQVPLSEETARGTFVPPTIIEIDAISTLKREVFGPVLHVLRFRRDRLDALVDQINATGYGLTFGLHTRIDETVERVTHRAAAGNIYVNRNLIGAVVGVQPFGGHGLSGTGPKAGGPLYLYRLLAMHPGVTLPGGEPVVEEAAELWWRHLGEGPAPALLTRYAVDLAGPVGEQNRYELEPCGAVLCVATTLPGIQRQIGVALATGNLAYIDGTSPFAVFETLPEALRAHVVPLPDRRQKRFGAVLYQGDPEGLLALAANIATLGPILSIQTEDAGYRPEGLLVERSISVNTAAAGGNAHLMAVT